MHPRKPSSNTLSLETRLEASYYHRVSEDDHTEIFFHGSNPGIVTSDILDKISTVKKCSLIYIDSRHCSSVNKHAVSITCRSIDLFGFDV